MWPIPLPQQLKSVARLACESSTAASTSAVHTQKAPCACTGCACARIASALPESLLRHCHAVCHRLWQNTSVLRVAVPLLSPCQGHWQVAKARLPSLAEVCFAVVVGLRCQESKGRLWRKSHALPLLWDDSANLFADTEGQTGLFCHGGATVTLTTCHCAVSTHCQDVSFLALFCRLHCQLAGPKRPKTVSLRCHGIASAHEVRCQDGWCAALRTHQTDRWCSVCSACALHTCLPQEGTWGKAVSAQRAGTTKVQEDGAIHTR